MYRDWRIVWLLLLLTGCGALTRPAWAASDSHLDQGFAYSHCVTLGVTQAAQIQAAAPAGFTYTFSHCNPGGSPLSSYSVLLDRSYNGNPDTQNFSACGISGFSGLTCQHNFTAANLCAGRPTTSNTFQVSGQALDSGTTQACHEGCGYNGTVESGVCVGYGTPVSYWCPVSWAPTGAICQSNSMPSPSFPPGGAYDCTNTQCVGPSPDNGNAPSNPVDQSGIIGSPPGTTEPPPQTSTGGAGAGDGDSSTPIAGGNGGGAGQEGGDCNPLSNPDCDFRGSATTSGDCSVVPSCDGDPVGCAILRQSWSTMCHGKASELELSADCTVAPTCTGDPIGCAQIQMDFIEACQWYDGGQLSDVTEIWNDPALTGTNPFDAENQTLIDVEGALDYGGFLGGGACPIQDMQISMGPLGDMSIALSTLCTFLPILYVGFMLAGGVQSAMILKDAI